MATQLFYDRYDYLVGCPHCGDMMARHAFTCPHCGGVP